jgi:glucose-1-phosphate cytidylyltransferase
MVPIGDTPILEHIMRRYAAFGHRDFVVACGHLGQVIKEYFATYRSRHSDFTLSLATGEVAFHDSTIDDWNVSLVDTGNETMTGGRLGRLKPYLEQQGTFMMTYGDGVADIDIDALLSHHQRSGCIATVTAVRPPARFGSLVISAAGKVEAFEEKISTSEAFINGGYFVFEPEVFGYLGNDLTSFEREPMERLAADGQLAAYIHNGFWKPMDTLRDKFELDGMWADGTAPWTL